MRINEKLNRQKDEQYDFWDLVGLELLLYTIVLDLNNFVCYTKVEFLN